MSSRRDEVRDTFIAEVIAAFRRQGETGAIDVERAPFFMMLLQGPPLRRRMLTPLYATWLHAPEQERAQLIDEFAAQRFGSDVATANPRLLTDVDIDQTAMGCCGDADLLFVRCPACESIWIECYECSTWHFDLNGSQKMVSCFEEHLRCPVCRALMPMTQGHDPFLPTLEQVVAAGLDRFLAPRLR